ncbi:hypothetical protein [Leekyejoonella antrihumi]|uniref:Uncharacterized protein n=1 Tax=Leekyejoonella antrihumi TaxID=1660198 RepID=A0A563E1U1_9MICO|nr:hypothetical protein [Leekyejoonella antrihumi]TWP36203.1 hypothetical protein FGL98_10925 [Leekyejoonella antrihumi]
MEHTTYRITWTRDPGREAWALLRAVRGVTMGLFLILALILLIFCLTQAAWLVAGVLVVLMAVVPVSVWNRTRHSIARGGTKVSIALSGTGLSGRTPDKFALPWDTFTHWRATSTDIVLVRKRGRLASRGMLIPLSAVTADDRPGITDLLDKHLTRL